MPEDGLTITIKLRPNQPSHVAMTRDSNGGVVDITNPVKPIESRDGGVLISSDDYAEYLVDRILLSDLIMVIRQAFHDDDAVLACLNRDDLNFAQKTELGLQAHFAQIETLGQGALDAIARLKLENDVLRAAVEANAIPTPPAIVNDQ